MKLLLVVILFATIGLALARDFLVTMGFQVSLPVIGALGLAVTTMLVLRNLLAILAIVILTLMISLPQEMLQAYHLDPDILLAGVLLIIIYPWIHKLASDSL